MGLADYFSRLPTSKAIPPSKEDNTFVRNIINSIKILIKRLDKFSANKITESHLECNDVINAKQRKQIEQHAFSHSLYTYQPHQFVLNIQNIISYKSIVNVCTRIKSHKNTIEQPITKKFRVPNKIKLNMPDDSDNPSGKTLLTALLSAHKLITSPTLDKA